MPSNTLTPPVPPFRTRDALGTEHSMPSGLHLPLLSVAQRNTAWSSSMGTKRETGRRRRPTSGRAIADETAPDAAVTAAVIEIGFPELVRRLAALELPPIEVVVGIGRGGVVPAALARAAAGLQPPCSSGALSRRRAPAGAGRAAGHPRPPSMSPVSRCCWWTMWRAPAPCCAPPQSTRWWLQAAPTTPCSRWTPASPGRGRPQATGERYGPQSSCTYLEPVMLWPTKAARNIHSYQRIRVSARLHSPDWRVHTAETR